MSKIHDILAYNSIYVQTCIYNVSRIAHIAACILCVYVDNGVISTGDWRDIYPLSLFLVDILTKIFLNTALLLSTPTVQMRENLVTFSYYLVVSGQSNEWQWVVQQVFLPWISPSCSTSLGELVQAVCSLKGILADTILG